MKVIEARNPHEALPEALELLFIEGEKRDSRNGPVLVMPCPVTTVYKRPWERVVFWEERDANPFFHLYESLWMLAGRNDIKPLTRYASNMMNYSDDGVTQHGAYGHRWRNAWDPTDQLEVIIRRLSGNKDDRRCVLQMWDTQADLDRKLEDGSEGKDVPCNLVATFQVSPKGHLDMTVFCRSNDIVWGAYGANAVHFSMLQEYMASRIGIPVGTYTQVSVNWHGYLNTLQPLEELRERYTRTSSSDRTRPYEATVRHAPMPKYRFPETLDIRIKELVAIADFGCFHGRMDYISGDTEWIPMVYTMFEAHHLFKTLAAPEKYEKAMDRLYALDQAYPQIDWVASGLEWLRRRHVKWVLKMSQKEVS